MADEFDPNDGTFYTPTEEPLDEFPPYDDVSLSTPQADFSPADFDDSLDNGYGYADDVAGAQDPDSTSSMQQTLSRAGDVAADAARNASAAMAEGFSAIKNVANASREHNDAKAQMREMQNAFDQDMLELNHRLDIEENYEQIVATQTAEIQAAQSAARDATAEIEALSQERDSLNNQLAQLKANNDQTLRPNKALAESARARADDANRVLADTRRAVKDAESQVSEAERRLKQNIAAANRTLEDAQDRLARTQDNLKALENNPGSALSSIFDMRAEVAQETAAVDSARAEIQRVTADSQYLVDSAEQQLATQRQALESAQRDYDTAKKEADDRKAELERLEKECEKNEQAVQREIDNRVARINDAGDAMRDAEHRINEAQGILDEANDIHSTREYTEALIASVTEQKAALDAQQAHIDELAASEKNLRESTRSKRYLFIGVIAAAVVLVILILVLIFNH